MANIYTIIQRKLNQDLFSFSEHFLDELANENFEIDDALRVVRKPVRRYSYTDDKSHARYAFEGYSNDGRMLRVIVFLSQGKVRFKTAYQI